MRTFIRHPSDIPIEIHEEISFRENEKVLSNVSMGGLCFTSRRPYTEGSTIKIKISFVNPTFEALGQVVWCKQENEHFDIGIEFNETKDAFRARMIEQVCHIEHYKKEIREREGRDLSGTEAALEWISKYADNVQSDTLKK